MSTSDLSRRIAYIITGLEEGGAQHSLLRLASRMPPAGWEPSVMSLRSLGSVGPKMERLGIGVSCLQIHSVLGGTIGALELRRRLRSLEPEIVQGWMYHGNMAASAASGRRAHLWNIRNALHESADKWVTRLLIRMGAVLSQRPAYIVYNSLACARQHESLGYAGEKRVVIPNGFDLTVWRPRPEDGLRLRQTLAIPPGARVVGMVARYHPVKNHEGFIELASALRSSHRDVHFLCAGEGVTEDNANLTSSIREGGLEGRMHLLGEHDDLGPVYSAMDVLVLPSLSEAFPNVVGEAMASQVPCVVTDVGECKTLVKGCGLVTEVADSGALTRATATLLSLSPASRKQLGEAGRARVRNSYSVEREIQSYLELYREVVGESEVFEYEP